MVCVLYSANIYHTSMDGQQRGPCLCMFQELYDIKQSAVESVIAKSVVHLPRGTFADVVSVSHRLSMFSSTIKKNNWPLSSTVNMNAYDARLTATNADV